jgi:flagellar basal-body rod protein FlgG
MNDALYIAATGMQSQQTYVDTVANNLANLNTNGYKAGRVNFEDMVYRMAQTSAESTKDGVAGLASQPHGTGANISSISNMFTQGSLVQSTGPTDMAIQGNGFLEVTLADGTHAYSRGGSLQVNADGFLATADGSVLKPAVHVGIGLQKVTINTDGTVMVQPNGQGNPTQVGNIEMANFSDTSGLVPIGQNLYQSSARSGEPVYGKPGENGFGTISQGYLETSNVNMINEMVNLMTAQRAYEMNVKVIQAADEMAGMSNNLRR